MFLTQAIEMQVRSDLCLAKVHRKLSWRELMYVVVSLTGARPPPEILCQFSLQLNHNLP